MPGKPGERLEALMKDAGHTRKSLAAALGVHPNTLANWITGDYSPRDPHVRERLAAEIGADVFATYVVAGDNPQAMRLEDVPQDVFIDEVVRRLRSGATAAGGPFIVTDAAEQRSRDGNPDGNASAQG